MEEHTATIMVIHHMNKNNEILTLTQLFSSSFPVGSFAYSHGMETAINDGLITNANDLEQWISSLLKQGGAWSDAAFLNIAFDVESSNVCYINSYAKAFASSNERLKETVLQGHAYCEAVNSIWDLNLKKLFLENFSTYFLNILNEIPNNISLRSPFFSDKTLSPLRK